METRIKIKGLLMVEKKKDDYEFSPKIPQTEKSRKTKS
jgi:hypothetical protein